MKIRTTNRFANVDVYFGYSNKQPTIMTTYAKGAAIWEKAPVALPQTASREKAELAALTGVLNSFDRSARIQLHGFSTFKANRHKEHKANQAAWDALINLLKKGANGNFFDIISFDDEYNAAIDSAQAYSWKPMNNMEHIAKVTTSVKAKAAKTATVKAGTKLIAKAAPAAEAKAEKAEVA